MKKKKNNVSSFKVKCLIIGVTMPIKSHSLCYNKFLQTSIKVNINTKTLIDACIEIVIVNGRPYNLMDDTEFKIYFI